MKTTDVTANPQDTRQRALLMARQIFVQNGLAGFSVRKVARALGISLGHLQHYFASRDDLLAAMLEATAEGYSTAYDGIAQAEPRDAAGRFDRMIRFLLDDLENSELSVFFLEFWTLAIRDAAAGDMLRRIYESNLAGVSRFVADVRPDLDGEAVAALALHVQAMIDGLLLYRRTIDPRETDFGRVKAQARNTMLHLVMTAPPPRSHLPQS